MSFLGARLPLGDGRAAGDWGASAVDDVAEDAHLQGHVGVGGVDVAPVAVGAVGLAEVVDEVVVDAALGEQVGSADDGVEVDVVLVAGLVLADGGGVAVASRSERVEVVPRGRGPGRARAGRRPADRMGAASAPRNFSDAPIKANW